MTEFSFDLALLEKIEPFFVLIDPQGRIQAVGSCFGPIKEKIKLEAELLSLPIDELFFAKDVEKISPQWLLSKQSSSVSLQLHALEECVFKYDVHPRNDHILLAGQPIMKRPEQLVELGLGFQHFSAADPTIQNMFAIQAMQTALSNAREIGKQLEKKVITRTEKLEAAREEALHASQAKGTFLANMSHEIRTPMNAIIGFLDLALEESINDNVRDYIETSSRSANSLLTIINDILDISKLESGTINIEVICFDLRKLIEDVIKTLDFKVQESPVNLIVSYHEDLSRNFLGDPTRLRQVLINLLGNSIKFTDKGDITIIAEPDGEADFVKFCVEDEGIGMSQEQCDGVFNPFQQADESTSRKYGGTGLGTTISKQIVELMQGTIWVESELGVGTKFIFRVNLQSTDLPTEEALNKEIPARSCDRLFKILLAEDIAENAKLAMHRLKEQEHEVVWAENGLKALDAFKEEDYDLVLMDVNMPEMDGLESTQKIRQFEVAQSREATCILALTASVLEEDQRECLDSGMDAVASKPIDFNALFNLMESTIAASKGRLRVGGIDTSKELKPANLIDFSCLQGVVDVEKGLSVWGDETIFARSLKSFIRDRHDSAALVQSLLSQSNYVQIQALAHAIKGLAGNLCIEGLPQTAEVIEQAAKAKEHGPIEDNLAPLAELLEGAKLAIDLFEFDDGEKKIDLEAFDQDEFKNLKEQLEQSLKMCNPDEPLLLLEQMAKLVEQERLREIKNHIDDFCFEEAQDALNQLSQELL